MGAGSWDAARYATFSASTVGASTAAIYKSRTLHKDLDPKGVAIRESRDSDINPNSTPLIVGIDVTGSMGMLADTLAREGLGTLFTEILERKPITDPHVMFMAIGDANYDSAPLQVSQFEADHRIIKQLTDIYLEHGGGGNNFESYNLPWYFAAMHTSIDSFEKRGKKGYLFTVGDECFPSDLTAHQIERVLGDKAQRVPTNDELLEAVGRMYHVFHLMVEEGSHMHDYSQRVVDSWTSKLGQRALRLADHKKMSEVIVSTIQVTEGADKDKVTGSWSGDTALVVAHALEGFKLAERSTGGSGVKRF